ncbi:MAG: hypothetical protein QOE63_1795 [Acidimicrobiaceae bacterium]
MATFASFDGIEIAYDDEGTGAPVVLLHGFAADATINWRGPGVIDALVADGRRVISYDARGHGRSGKPHEPAAYENDAMVKDAVALLDHLELGPVDVAGYSMGALVTLRLIHEEPRVRSAVLGGIGGAVAPTGAARTNIADALESADPSSAPPAAKAFRAFADSTGADLRALAAIQRASIMQKRVDLSGIAIPCLVLVGDRDDLAKDAQQLVDRIPGASLEVISGTHLSAVNDPRFAQDIVQFFNAQAPKPA